jgi:hypothetical protein
LLHCLQKHSPKPANSPVFPGFRIPPTIPDNHQNVSPANVYPAWFAVTNVPTPDTKNGEPDSAGGGPSSFPGLFYTGNKSTMTAPRQLEDSCSLLRWSDGKVWQPVVNVLSPSWPAHVPKPRCCPHTSRPLVHNSCIIAA